MSDTTTKIEVVVSQDQHWYPSTTKENVHYPSVTTILSVYPKGEGFNRYLASQTSWESSQEILKSASKRGTNVHQASELLEQGRTLQRDSYTLEEWEMLMGYVNWRKDSEYTLIHTELPIVSDLYKTGGTIDRVYRNERDEYFIVDLKTSSAIHGNYWVQVAAYAQMYEKSAGVQIAGVGILRLAPRKKSGYEYKIILRSEWRETFKIFKAAQVIWEHMNPGAGPRILEVPTTLSL